MAGGECRDAWLRAGNLAASVALRARDAGSVALAFQMLLYPVCDAAMDTSSYTENSSLFPLSAEEMAWFWEQYVPVTEDRLHPYASPLRAASLAGLPPAHIITAELDPLRDEGRAYARALAAADVRTSYANYDGMVHGFLAIAGHLPKCAAVRQSVAGILAAELRG
jgi:acetyl esterase